MRQRHCPRSDEILRAAGGPLPAVLVRHAAACRECAEARLVDDFLRAGAARMAPLNLPAAEAVRWRARLRARADRAARAARPIALLDRLGYAAGAAALGALALVKGAPALALLRTLGEAAAVTVGAAPSAPGAIAATVPASMALAVAAILLAAPPLAWCLYLIWVDE